MKILIIGLLSCFAISLGAIMFFTGTFSQRSTQELAPQPDSSAEEEIVATEDTLKEEEQQVPDLQTNEDDAELETLQAKLEEYRAQITEAETKLTTIKAEIDALSAVKSSLTRSKQMAKVYSSMKPDSVALILCEMEVDLSIQILTQMSDRTSAKVMDAIAELDPDYAAEIGKSIAGTHGT